MQNHEEMELLVEGYALLALDADERRAFEEHMATCFRCAQRVAEARAVVHTLAFAVEEMTPPLKLRQRVLAAVREEKAGASFVSATRRVSLSFWRGFFARPAALSATTIALVVMMSAVSGLAFWTYRLQDSLATSQYRLDETYQAIDIMGRADSRWSLNGTPAAPQTTGVLAYSSRHSASCLVLWNLPEADGGHYHAWVNKDGVVTSTGPMWRVGSGVWLIIPGSPQQLDSLLVTLERQSYPAQPGGPVVASLSLADQ